MYKFIKFSKFSNFFFVVVEEALDFLKIFANVGKILASFRKKNDFRAVQRSAFCRSQRELSNAYLLAKFCFDTAEYKPSKACAPPAPTAPTGPEVALEVRREVRGQGSKFVCRDAVS